MRGVSSSSLRFFARDVLRRALPWAATSELRSVKERMSSLELSAGKANSGEESSREHLEVAVVGGGQAGLAMGYYLRAQGLRFAIFERGDSIAPAWRERWDSLTLFTPRRYSALPGLPFPGDPDGYPTRDEVIAYLERYAETFEFPIELNSDVRRLSHEGGRLRRRGRRADGHRRPSRGRDRAVPDTVRAGARRRASAPGVWQVHSTGYRQPGDVPEGTVLVVGGGNTGFQIAKELSATHKVVLSVGSKQKPLPQRIAGRDLFWWLTKTRPSLHDRRIAAGEQAAAPGHVDRIEPARARAPLRRRAQAARDGCQRTAQCASRTGASSRWTPSIWATGYRPDFSWIDLPILDSNGRLRHRRGVTDVPGLYFLGLTWQWTRGSALIGWVKDDAAFLTERLAASNEAKTRAAARA